MLATFVIGMVVGTATLGAPTSPMPEPSPRCDISLAVPQFGGAYVTDGVLHIWLTETGVDKDAAAATLARQCPTLVAAGTSQIEIHDADFSYAQLHAWEMTARGLLSRPGVSMTGVNQKTNRVMIGLHDVERDRAEITAELARLGVPGAAVEFIEATDVVAGTAPPFESAEWTVAAVAGAIVVGVLAFIGLRRRQAR